MLVAAIRTPAMPLQATGEPTAGDVFGRALAEWRDGLRLVRHDRVLVAVFSGLGLGFIGEGTFESRLAPLMLDTLGAGPAGAGLLMSLQAIGGLVAGVFIAAIASRVAPARLFGLGLIGFGVCDLGMVFSANIGTAGG